VRLPGPADPDGDGVLRVSGREAILHVPPGRGFTGDGRDVEGPARLLSDAEGEPTRVRRGSVELHLIARGGRLAVRVRDADHDERRKFRGITSYPIDPAWRIEARFEAYDPPRRRDVAGVQGTVEEETFPGAVLFEAAGGLHRLEAIRERGETDYWIIFGDATNGRETYGAGRFVYVPPPAGGRTVVDFNKAYNPPCAFNPFSTCPLPPAGNRLPIRVEAGEKFDNRVPVDLTPARPAAP
jgi:uncharacterized protein (DUF1684 family)